MSFALLVAGVDRRLRLGERSGRPHRGWILPYDLEADGNTVYVADGLRHQILRYDLATRRLTVHAGTGSPGTSGDGGPAARARLTEPTELVLDRAGNLYFSDVNQGRVRRIDRRGIITTVTRVPAAAGVAVDPSGRYLAIASIEGWVYRMDIRDRRSGVGWPATAPRRPGGDGGPAVNAPLNGPHDVTYDAGGNLLIAELTSVRRIDARTGDDRDGVLPPGVQGHSRPARDVLPARRPTQRRHDHAGGCAGRGAEGDRHRQALAGTPTGPRIGRVGFLPSDIEPVAGGLLISQTKPVPALRRLAGGQLDADDGHSGLSSSPG